MNWPVIITFASIILVWFGLAKLFSAFGFMEDERELLKEYNKKKNKIK